MTLLARLDYAGDEILMIAETEIEKTKRVKAVAKETETVDFILSMEPGSVFYDLGANVGSYTLIALSRGLEVVAFEASVPNFQRLNENLGLNGFKCKTVCPPLWSHQTRVEWTDSVPDTPGAALHSMKGGVGDRLAFPLDYWTDPYGPSHLPMPNYLKIDLDGNELAALQGATRTLEGASALLVEHDSEVESHKDIPALLEGLGFKEGSRHPHGTSSVTNVIWRR